MSTERVAAQLAYNVASMQLAFVQHVSNIIEVFVSNAYKFLQAGIKFLIQSFIKGNK